MSFNMYDAIHQSRKAAFTLLYWVKHYKQGLFNPLSANSDQQQFSPNNIHTLSRDTVMRINKMITIEKMFWSFIKFSLLILKGNVWRSVWRICMWILGLKGLKTKGKFPVEYHVVWIGSNKKGLLRTLFLCPAVTRRSSFLHFSVIFIRPPVLIRSQETNSGVRSSLIKRSTTVVLPLLNGTTGNPSSREFELFLRNRGSKIVRKIHQNFLPRLLV